MVRPIFTLDKDAVQTLEDSDFNLVVKPKGKPEYTLGEGTQFAVISRDNLEVRATMIDEATGKPKRGRPRRFPAALVTRLLGDGGVVEDKVETEAETPVESVLEDTVVETEVEEQEETEEERLEKEAREQRVAALFEGSSETDADWQ